MGARGIRSRPQWTEDRYTLVIAAIDDWLARRSHIGPQHLVDEDDKELRVAKATLLHDRELLMRREDRRRTRRGVG